MSIVLIALMLIIAVLASNFISKFLPQIATPLVQIALGAALSLFIAVPADFELPSELFMALFVAPLIYSDSKNIDRVNAWKNRGTILKLAIGLVVATTLVVGFVMGNAIAALPLAAAFVLGAALSPTDPVAVNALGETTSTTTRQKAILSTESIVNDATGIVVFNLALAALATGAFSLVDASASFLFLFFGGIAVGLAVGMLANLLSSTVRRLGYDDIVFHVLLDVAMPFITFLTGEALGVSPIMAVMVCALVYKIGVGKAGPDESRMNIISTSVWKVLSFALNGFVFVMLGFQLRAAIADIAESGAQAGELAAAATLLVALVVGLRFAWICVMELLEARRAAKRAGKTEAFRERMGAVARNAAVLTFAGGTKGAITLSVAFSIPYAVASRSLIVFLVSVTVICTFVFTNLFVPILAPAPKKSPSETAMRERAARIGILRQAIKRLLADADEKTEAATREVVADYNLRIDALSKGLPDEDVGREPRRVVREHALRLEAKRCGELMDAGKVSDEDGYAYLNRLNRLMRALGRRNRVRWLFERGLRGGRSILRAAIGLLRERADALFGGEDDEPTLGVREVQRACAEYVIEELGREEASGTYPVEAASRVIADYRRAIDVLDANNPSLTTIAAREIQKDEIQLRGVGYELEAIQDALDAGEIGHDTARRLKDNAYLMRLDLENLV